MRHFKQVQESSSSSRSKFKFKFQVSSFKFKNQVQEVSLVMRKEEKKYDVREQRVVRLVFLYYRYGLPT